MDGILQELDTTVGRVRVRCATAARRAAARHDLPYFARQLVQAMRDGDLLVADVDGHWETIVRGEDRAELARLIAPPAAAAVQVASAQSVDRIIAGGEDAHRRWLHEQSENGR